MGPASLTQIKKNMFIWWVLIVIVCFRYRLLTITRFWFITIITWVLLTINELYTHETAYLTNTPSYEAQGSRTLYKRLRRIPQSSSNT